MERVDIDRILAITPEELNAAMKVAALKKDAITAAEYIRHATACFAFGEKSINIGGGMSFSYEGEWFSRDGARIKVKCTADEIFELYKAEYFEDHSDFKGREKYLGQSVIAKDFRNFVKQCKDLFDVGRTFKR